MSMRVVLQRVKEAQVTVDGEVSGRIGTGLLVFVGVGKEDTTADAEYLVSKILALRVFPGAGDSAARMDRNVLDVDGGVLIVSQFTLYASTRRGRRPSFDAAAPPETARVMYEYFVRVARESGARVATGVFQASMAVSLTNDGPVTLVLDSAEKPAAGPAASLTENAPAF